MVRSCKHTAMTTPVTANRAGPLRSAVDIPLQRRGRLAGMHTPFDLLRMRRDEAVRSRSYRAPWSRCGATQRAGRQHGSGLRVGIYVQLKLRKDLEGIAQLDPSPSDLDLVRHNRRSSYIFCSKAYVERLAEIIV